MIKQDWLTLKLWTVVQQLKQRSHMLAAGEFQEEQVAQEAFNLKVLQYSRPSKCWLCCCSSCTRKKWLHSTLLHQKHQYKRHHTPAAAPEVPVQEAPQFAAAPETPVQVSATICCCTRSTVQEAPQYTAKPEAPVQEAQYTVAPEAPVQEAPQFNALLQKHQSFCAQPNGFQQGSTQPVIWSTSPGQGFQQAPYPGQPSTRSLLCVQPGQPNAFGQADERILVMIASLCSPNSRKSTKILNGILHYVLTAFILSLSLFFVASASHTLR